MADFDSFEEVQVPLAADNLQPVGPVPTLDPNAVAADPFGDGDWDTSATAAHPHASDGYVEDATEEEQQEQVGAAAQAKPLANGTAHDQYSFSEGDVLSEAEPAAASEPLHQAFYESAALREWRMARQAQLAEERTLELERKAELKNKADQERDTFYVNRERLVDTTKQDNRTKEEQDLQAMAAIAQCSNTWEAVVSMVEIEAEAKKKKKSADDELKKTDTSRMRQLLVKLKNNPIGVRAQ
eukprot:jgi/Chlat1/4319/Chrsp29S04605